MSHRSEQVSLFAALFEAKVEYAMVGGVAVNAHDFVRNTRDRERKARTGQAAIASNEASTST